MLQGFLPNMMGCLVFSMYDNPLLRWSGCQGCLVTLPKGGGGGKEMGSTEGVVVEEGMAVVVVKDHIEDITVEGNQAAATVDKGLATGDTMVKRMNRWKASRARSEICSKSWMKNWLMSMSPRTTSIRKCVILNLNLEMFKLSQKSRAKHYSKTKG